MDIKFSCPKCGQHYEVSEAFIGKEAVCDKCGHRFTVGKSVPPPPPPKTAPPPPPPQKHPDLTTCYACGGVVHIKARTCPHCGNPRRSGVGAGSIATGIFQILLLFIGFPLVVGGATTAGGAIMGVIAAIWCATFILCLK